MRPRKRLNMSPLIDGRGTTMRPLPGSQRMVGGPKMCMYHELQPALVVGDWTCRSLYMHIAYEIPRPYNGTDCLAVSNAVEVLRRAPLAASILFERQQVPGHPLPGFFTVPYSAHRIDFFVYRCEAGRRHLWAQVYRPT